MATHNDVQPQSSPAAFVVRREEKWPYCLQNWCLAGEVRSSLRRRVGSGRFERGCLRTRQQEGPRRQLKRARLACASPRQPPIQFAANNTKDAGESPPRDGRCLHGGGRRVYAEAFRKAVLVRRRLHRDIGRPRSPA